VAQTEIKKPVQHANYKDESANFSRKAIELHFHPLVFKCVGNSDQGGANHEEHQENDY
jgi:hypothetical protein